MLGEMTAAQLVEWQEFARVEPFGFDIQADMLAVLCAVVANSAPFRSGDAIPPSRFRLRPGAEADATTIAPDVRDALGGSTPVGPDLSRPIPDDD